VLTGDGGSNNNGYFTCEELEVYQVIEWLIIISINL
jgi:hypothetical protein